VNGVDPSGEIALALSLGIGIAIQSGLRASKGGVEVTAGTIAGVAINGFFQGIAIGIFFEMFFPPKFIN
jgi:hypothetical protein